MTSGYVYNCKIPQLDSVGKTFVWLFVSYFNSPIYQLDFRLCSALAKFFSIPEEIIVEFSTKDENNICYNAVRFADGSYGKIEYYDYNLLKSLIEISIALDILDKNELKSIDHNLWEGFSDVYTYLSLANLDISHHESLSADYGWNESSPFNNSYYDVSSLLDLMKYLVFLNGEKIHNKLLDLAVRIIRFDLFSQCRVLCVIAICLILKQSPFIMGEVADIASELHDLFFYILQNARLYSLQTNVLRTTGSNPKKRNASNNTTRLRMCYGYSNFDAYVLRLDLAHKGENFVHINNESPAQLSCCIFSEDDYQRIINNAPCAKDLFIKYGNRYALKERNNCNLTELNKNMYDDIAKEGAHFNVFSNNYSENSIEVYLTYLSSILSGISKKIKKGDNYSTTCFHYNRIMMLARLLYSACSLTNKGCIDKAIETIIQTGIMYKILDSKDVTSGKTESVIYIIDYVTDCLDSLEKSFI